MPMYKCVKGKKVSRKYLEFVESIFNYLEIFVISTKLSI